ncbi:MAG: HhH-GPD-type base excision DNA repair protein [Actinomycetota bacterium]
MSVEFSPTGDPEADELVTERPLALLIGMLLDQQISIELAFTGPLRLSQRLGGLEAASIADHDPEDLARIFAVKPALHRFPASMSKRTQALCAHLVESGRSDGDLWSDQPTARVLHERISELPGFGAEKTKILIAVLAKRFGVRPRGWKALAGSFADNQPRSVADMDSEAGRARVREWKKRQRAEGRSKQD